MPVLTLIYSSVLTLIYCRQISDIHSDNRNTAITGNHHGQALIHWQLYTTSKLHQHYLLHLFFKKKKKINNTLDTFV